MPIDLRTLSQYQHIFNRAPSAHNTQPWLLSYFRDKLELQYDPARSLPISDPTQRDLWLGLGAFVETVSIVCHEQGVDLEFDWQPDEATQRIGFFKPAARQLKTLFTSQDILSRQTSRLPYDGAQVLSPAQLAELHSLLPSWLKLRQIDSTRLLEPLHRADTELLAQPAYVQELRSWLRLDPQATNYWQDGLNAETMVLSWWEVRLLKFLLSPALAWWRQHGLSRVLASFSSSFFRPAQPVLVLVSQKSGSEATLEAGRYLLQLWLQVSRWGWYTHPLSQLLDAQDSRQQLRTLLNTNFQENPLAVFRVGTSSPPVRSGRLQVG